ncbi:hypothetical protein CXZ05_13540 [Arthrobacter sp. AFG20]|nr:hypothetical protein CXZ05_13540 [Arthrobacter sp. AFG20]
MRKEELVKKVANARSKGNGDEDQGDGSDTDDVSTGRKGGSKQHGADTPGNDTPNTPDVSETELRKMKVDELRQEAREENIAGASGMRKEDLVKEVVNARSKAGGASRGKGEDTDPEDLGAGPEGGKIRHGEASSKSLKYSQEITSTEDEAEREGRSLATTHREVIRQWAEERGGTPATVEGTEHGDHLGVLRIDFGGEDKNLRRVSWEEWFNTFDARRLNFIYQEQRSDGNQSNFFRLENPEREDA